MNAETMRARFRELNPQREAIRAKALVIREQRDAIEAKARAEMEKLDAQIREIEAPIAAITEEMVLISRALNGKT